MPLSSQDCATQLGRRWGRHLGEWLRCERGRWGIAENCPGLVGRIIGFPLPRRHKIGRRRPGFDAFGAARVCKEIGYARRRDSTLPAAKDKIRPRASLAESGFVLVDGEMAWPRWHLSMLGEASDALIMAGALDSLRSRVEAAGGGPGPSGLRGLRDTLLRVWMGRLVWQRTPPRAQGARPLPPGQIHRDTHSTGTERGLVDRATPARATFSAPRALAHAACHRDRHTPRGMPV